MDSCLLILVLLRLSANCFRWLFGTKLAPVRFEIDGSSYHARSDCGLQICLNFATMAVAFVRVAFFYHYRRVYLLLIILQQIILINLKCLSLLVQILMIPSSRIINCLYHLDLSALSQIFLALLGSSSSVEKLGMASSLSLAQQGRLHLQLS